MKRERKDAGAMIVRTALLPCWSVALLTLGCGDGSDESSDQSARIELAIVGQALIEHDPRDYLDAPLRSVAQILGDVDVAFTNLEVAVAGPSCTCQPTRTDVYFHGTDATVLDYLGDLGVSLVSLANNHSWDYGTEGVLSTIAEAEARGIVHAGTGHSEAAAVAPSYLTVGDLRLSLVAAASVNSPDEARATENRAGVNMLEPGSVTDWDRNLASIEVAARTSDIVIVYQHLQTDAEAGWQERWARAAIDAGADIYVSHGEPTLSGVEVYRERLILYGLGNFIFHTRTELGRYPSDVWESVIAEVLMERRGAIEVTFTPVVLDRGSEGPLFFETRGYPKVSEPEVGDAILRRLRALSLSYGTVLELAGGKATLQIRERG
jgi:poly-gamma-glutamate synthesis protein (capsule biosynthesis protein)